MNETFEVRAATAQELNLQYQAVQAASASASALITPDKFVFFACFDGTNNDRENLSTAQDYIKTNVAAIELLAASSGNANLESRYYPGPGTAGTLTRLLPKSTGKQKTRSASFSAWAERSGRSPAAAPSAPTSS